MGDYYATLGVAQRSEDIVIRAAYLALMRRYHPDTNPSPDAAERVREVTTAYNVLSDKDRRADYDSRRELGQSASPVFDRPRRLPVGPIFFGATILFGSLAVLAVWIKPLGQTPDSDAAAGSGPALAAADAPGTQLAELGCVGPDTTAAINRELVRQASKLRAVDRRTLVAIAPQMAVRLSPALITRDPAAPHRVGCSVAVEMTLPQGVALPDGRQVVNGKIDYIVRSQAGTAAPRMTFAPADEMAVQLASLRSSPSLPQAPTPVLAPQPAPALPIQPRVALAAAAPVKVAPRPMTSVRPMANVRPSPVAAPQVVARDAPLRPVPQTIARPAPVRVAARAALLPAPRPAAIKTAGPLPRPKAIADSGCRKYGTKWTELLCENKGLSALDQQLGAFDAQSWASASADKRERLRRSRGQFSATRIQCTTDACLRQLYLGRMKVVADIMASDRPASGRKNPN